METLATVLSLVVAPTSMLSGFLVARVSLPRGTAEEELPHVEKSLRINLILFAVAATGCAALSITETAQPRFYSLVLAGIGMATGMVGVLVGAVRQRHYQEPHEGRADPV